MKAFILYSKNETNLRKLLRKMQDYGKITCSFEKFNELYCEWHEKTFKGCKVSTNTALFRDDWFFDFLNFLVQCEVKHE